MEEKNSTQVKGKSPLSEKINNNLSIIKKLKIHSKVIYSILYQSLELFEFLLVISFLNRT